MRIYFTTEPIREIVTPEKDFATEKELSVHIEFDDSTDTTPIIKSFDEEELNQIKQTTWLVIRTMLTIGGVNYAVTNPHELTID